MAKFGPHVERLHAVAGSRGGKLIAVGGRRDAEVSGSRVHLIEAKGTARFSQPVDAPVHALIFAKDDLLVAGLGNGTIVAWDTSESGTRVFEHAAHEGPIYGLASDLSGDLLVSVGEDGHVRIFRLVVSGGKPSLELACERKLSGRPLRAAVFERTQPTLSVAGDDGVVRTGPVESFGEAKLRDMPMGEGGVSALASTGDGRIVAGCGDGSIRLAFLEGEADEEDRARDDAHTAPVRALTFGPELADEAGRPLPRRLISVGEDGALKAWQLDTKRKPRTLEVSSAPLFGMAHLVASARAKPEARGGKLVLVGHDRRISLVTLSEKSEPSDSIDRIESELARLGQDLRAKNAPVRVASVTALGELLEDDARVLLDGALANDREPDVRKKVADVLGATGRRRSRPALQAALNDAKKEVRDAALKALGVLDEDNPLSPVRAALGSQHEDMRALAVGRLPGLRQQSPLVPGLIADALSDSGPKVREAALDALYALEGADSLVPVRTALDRGPADVRVSALLRLAHAHRNQNDAGRDLVDDALDDREATVRRTAFLIAVGAKPRLASKLRRSDAAMHKRLREIEKDGSLAPSSEEGRLVEEDLSPLFAAIACRHTDTALAGARALALAGDGRATGALLQLSREAEPEVRRKVVEGIQTAAMAMPGDDRLTARLEWLLDDPDAQVRASSFQALLHLSEPAGAAGRFEQATTALRSAHEDVRVRALQVLVEFGGKGKFAKQKKLAEAADLLLGDALDDEAENVRGEAFRTLWAWHTGAPQSALERAGASRHADIRRRVVRELERQKGEWPRPVLLRLVEDNAAEVGLAAYEALTKTDAQKKQPEAHEAALGSPRPEVRAKGAGGVRYAPNDGMRTRLVELVGDDHPVVHIAAIEAIDRSWPDEGVSFARAFASIFYDLRVRAAELCGKRRDERALEPMREFLTIPETNLNRPPDELRQRAARALADLGTPKAIPFYVALLDDGDSIVREMAARGLATACSPSRKQPLIDALAHADLPVRSWSAEGLARLGDDRAVPVLAGTLKHEHRPLRLGAIQGFVALGPDGVRGILQGLEDPDRAIQDFVFAIIVARDIALARASLPPDLLLSALASAHPEIRFAAACALEARSDGDAVGTLAQELVGPPKPDRAGDMKDWPKEEERQALLNVVVRALASDHPIQRYAAALVLALRPQAMAFWREAKRLAKPSAGPWIPHTNWEDGAKEPRKKDWVRRLFAKKAKGKASSATERVLSILKYVGGTSPRAVPTSEATFDLQEVRRLVFGTYAGLLRQAPPPGEADETHRIRRDSVARLAELSKAAEVGRTAVLPIFRRAVSDPHHLVRKAGVNALRSLYPEGSTEPLRFALESSAADVGRAAVDELVAVAEGGDEQAAALAKSGVDAPNADVRSYTVGRLARLYESGSLEPWLIALGSQHPDVRLSVVDRLMDSRDERVTDALGKALESDHEDLRLKAAVALARRGDPRTVDVLGAFLRSEESSARTKALNALVEFANARRDGTLIEPTAPRRAAEVVVHRLEDDPDRSADEKALIAGLARIGSEAAADCLLAKTESEDATVRQKALEALLEIARDTETAPVPANGVTRTRYMESMLLPWLERPLGSKDVAVRARTVQALRDVDSGQAELLLAKVIEDRDETVRVRAAEALAFRAEHVEGATVDALATTLEGGRRELVLPAAEGLVAQRRAEAFRPLMLVLKAGEVPERQRAVLALGSLGDRRALEDLLPLVDPKSEIPDEDRVLGPYSAEALGAMLESLEGEEAKEVRETVEGLARDGAENVRKRALTGLRKAADDRSRTLLERVAADRYDASSVRRHAIRELSKLGRSESEPVLADMLEDNDSGLRRDANAALAKLFPDDKTRVSLLALNSRFSDVSRPAATFLAKKGDAKTLVSRLSEVKDDKVRRQLRRGLVRRQLFPTSELAELLGGTDAPSRTEAAWIAGASGRAELRDAVLQAIERCESDWREHRATSQNGSLARYEEAWSASFWAASRVEADAKALARRAADLEDAPAPVRREAVRYLGRHGDGSDLELLKRCLSSSAAEVRVAAGSAVAQLAPGQAAEVLEALQVADAAAVAPVARLAVAAKGESMLGTDAGRQIALPVMLGGGQVDALVSAAGKKGKAPERLLAIAALGRMGGEAALAALEKILADKGEDDAARAAAFKAARRIQRAAEVRFEDGQHQQRGVHGAGAPSTGSTDAHYHIPDDDDDDWDDDDEDWDDDD